MFNGVSNIKIPTSLQDLRRLKFSAKYLFLVILLLIFALEIFAVKDQVAIVTGFQNQPAPLAAKSSGARINFKDYEAIVNRINSAGSFVPTGGITNNPFSAGSVAPPAPRGATSTPASNNSSGALQAP